MTRRRRRRVPWPVTVLALPATLAAAAVLGSEGVAVLLRLVGLR